MADIFLSHSHLDRGRVRPIVNCLQAEKWSVWWDRRLVAGERWEPQLRDELKNCRTVIVAWSRSAVVSRWVQLEAKEGLEIDGLVPVQLDAFADAPIPDAFRHIHAADLTAWSGDPTDPEFASILRGVREIVSRPPSSPNLADDTDLPFSLKLGGDLGSTDPRDLHWIQGSVEAEGRRAVPALLAALQFSEPERRGHAAYLLSLTGDRTIVGYLAPLLQDRAQIGWDIQWLPNTVRGVAAYALKRIGTTEALIAIADAFE